MSTFVIASLKNTRRDHAHIVFWAPFDKGYALAEPRYGRYCFGEAMSLNDGMDCIAIPAEAITALLVPEPYFLSYEGKPARFYDTCGQVIDNTRANWNALHAASITAGRHVAKIKPEVFRGKRRAFSLDHLARGL
jgi:hypothetical protein